MVCLPCDFKILLTVFNQSYNCQTSHCLGRNRLPKPLLMLPSLVPMLTIANRSLACLCLSKGYKRALLIRLSNSTEISFRKPFISIFLLCFATFTTTDTSPVHLERRNLGRRGQLPLPCNFQTFHRLCRGMFNFTTLFCISLLHILAIIG